MSDRGAATAPASFRGARRLAGAGARVAALGLGLALAVRTTAQEAHPPHEVDVEKAERDSANAAVLWGQVVGLPGPAPIADVAFAAVGRNIVTPVDIAWMVGGKPPELVAFAARPIPGTAAAGEELGRSGRANLQAPVALFAAPEGSTVLERDGCLVSLVSGSVDTLHLALGGQPALDLAIATTGLVHVLTARDVRIWPPGVGGAPLWTIALPPAAQPVTSLSVSARGEVYVAGGGKNVLTVFDLDAAGKHRVVRSRTAAQMGCKRATGIALLAAM